MKATYFSRNAQESLQNEYILHLKLEEAYNKKIAPQGKLKEVSVVGTHLFPWTIHVEVLPHLNSFVGGVFSPET